MSTTERAGGAVQAAGKATSGELLEAIRLAVETQRVEQTRLLRQLIGVGLMIVGASLGTMAGVVSLSPEELARTPSPLIFLAGLVVGLIGFCQWLGAAAGKKHLSQKQLAGNGPPPLKP